MNQKTFSRITGVIFIFFGLALILGGNWIYNSRKKIHDGCTETTSATVVSYKDSIRKSKASKTTVYAPVYEYEVNGTPYTGISDHSDTSKPFAIGTTIQIHYNPSYPDISYVTPLSPVIRYASFGGGGVMLLIGALGIAGKLTGRRRR